jgi:hypothetical protein
MSSTGQHRGYIKRNQKYPNWHETLIFDTYDSGGGDCCRKCMESVK